MGTYTIPSTDDGCVYITNGTIGASSIEADNPAVGSFNADSTFAVKIHCVKRDRDYQKAAIDIKPPESTATDSAEENTHKFVDLKRNTKAVTITGSLKDDSSSWPTGFDDAKVQMSWLDYLFNWNKVVNVVWGGRTTDTSRTNDNWVRNATGFTASIKRIAINELGEKDSIPTKEIGVIITLTRGSD